MLSLSSEPCCLENSQPNTASPPTLHLFTTPNSPNVVRTRTVQNYIRSIKYF